MVSGGKRGIRDPAAISFSIRFREITNDWSGDQGRGPETGGEEAGGGQTNAINAMQKSI